MSIDELRLIKICESAKKRLNEWEGRWVDRIGASTPTNPALPPDFGRQTDLFEYFRLVQVEYLMPGQTGFQLREIINKSIIAIDDYYFGDWRKVFAEPQKLRCEWFDELRIGMLLCLAIDDRDTLFRIIRISETDVVYDDGAWDRTESDNLFYKMLCKSILRDNLQQPPNLKGKRPNALQEVVNCIFANDIPNLHKKFTSYYSWFRKSEFDERGNLPLCLDGSLLVNLVKFRGHDSASLWSIDKKRLLVL